MELLNPLSVRRSQQLFSSKTFPAVCLSTDQVGHCVYIRADAIGGVLRVGKVNPTLDAKMPVVGVIISKDTATECVVQRAGDLPGYLGLLSGNLVFVGADSKLAQAPVLTPSVGGQIFVQLMGVALSSEVVELNISKHMTKRVG